MEYIINLITSWSPYIAAAATVVVGAIKVIKALASNTEKIKKEVLSIAKDQETKISNIAQHNLNIVKENEELKNTMSILLAQLANQNKLQKLVVDLQSQVINLTNSVKDQVNESLQKGYEAVELQKKELVAMGEYTAYEKFKN